jgi:hypothetical protein
MAKVAGKKNAPGGRVRVSNKQKFERENQASAEMTLPAAVEYAFANPFGL